VPPGQSGESSRAVAAPLKPHLPQGDDDLVAKARFNELQEAFDVLADEAKRREYDAALSHLRSTALRASSTVELDDCDIEEADGTAFAVAECRCGGQYRVELGAVSVEGVIVSCNSCSLKAHIVSPA
jgi:hypothetical protein